MYQFPLYPTHPLCIKGIVHVVCTVFLIPHTYFVHQRHSIRRVCTMCRFPLYNVYFLSVNIFFCAVSRMRSEWSAAHISAIVVPLESFFFLKPFLCIPYTWMRALEPCARMAPMYTFLFAHCLCTLHVTLCRVLHNYRAEYSAYSFDH